MIEESVKIHDKFSIEIKLGLNARKKEEVSDFVLNTWIFVPSSLDINPLTYEKKYFYRDVNSNIRLITPVYLLRDIAGEKNTPLTILQESFYTPHKILTYYWYIQWHRLFFPDYLNHWIGFRNTLCLNT